MTSARLLALAPVAMLLACATSSQRAGEVSDLRTELRAMRQSNDQLEQRIERLELLSQLAMAKAAPTDNTEGSGAAGAKADGPQMPDLVVVKLKPKQDPAPKLPVNVAIQEPGEEEVEAFVAPSETADSGAAREPMQEDPALLELAFDQAVANLRTGSVQLGVSRLEAFAADNPSHARADNALYFAALGRLGLDDHESAAALLERLVNKYPAGDAVQDGLLKLAECRLRLNQPQDAKALYTRLLTLFPGTAAAAQAEQRLAALSR